MSTMVAQRSIGAGASTGFGVHESSWARELTEDGRIYYFNRATGGSQWNIPNELYKSSCLARPGPGDATDEVATKTVWPTTAKATLMVDCVTESMVDRSTDAAASHARVLEQLLMALHAKPRDVQQFLPQLPGNIREMLGSDSFHDYALGRFATADEDRAGALIGPEACALADSIAADAEPSLAAGEEALGRLFITFDVDKLGSVDAAEFTDFLRFVMATRYIEEQLGMTAQ